MKLYEGVANDRDWQVLVSEGDDGFGRNAWQPLRNRTDLSNHSPDGFAWGYWGSGPAQLALSILADALGDDERALRLHQPFKSLVIAGIPQGADWCMSQSVVIRLAEIVESMREQRHAPGQPEKT